MGIHRLSPVRQKCPLRATVVKKTYDPGFLHYVFLQGMSIVVILIINFVTIMVWILGVLDVLIIILVYVLDLNA